MRPIGTPGFSHCVGKTNMISSQLPVNEAEEHQERYQNTGDLGQQHRPSPYTSDPSRYTGATLPTPTAGSTNWTQKNFDQFARATPILRFQLEQIHENAPQDYTYGQDPYYQSYQTATTTPDRMLPHSRPMSENDRGLTSSMNDMQLSHMPGEAWPQEDPGSTEQNYMLQHRASCQSGYPQQASRSNLHDQQQPAGFVAGNSLGDQGTARDTSHWAGHHYHPSSG